MFKWSGILFSVAVLSAPAFAAPSVYSQVEAKYNASAMPDIKTFKMESLWIGKCTASWDVERKSGGEIFFHADRDAVLGDSFYMIPRLWTKDSVVYTDEVNACMADFKAGYVTTEVTAVKTANAWYSNYTSGSLSYNYYLRQGTTKDGKSVALFMKVLYTKGEVAYCYFFNPVTQDMGTDTPVAPPPLDPVL